MKQTVRLDSAEPVADGGTAVRFSNGLRLILSHDEAVLASTDPRAAAALLRRAANPRSYR